MKKLLKSISMVLVFALCGGLMVGCGDDRTSLATNMISLSYTSTKYNGEEKTPEVTVTVGETVIDADEYTVEYSNNKEAGNATVKITADEDSDVISGSVSVGFVITQAAEEVDSLDSLTSIIENSNYNEADVTSNIVLVANTTLTIPENFTVNMGDNQLVLNTNAKLVLNGTLTSSIPVVNNGTITGDGEYIAYVDSLSELTAALRNANKVVLKSDIQENDGNNTINIYARNTKSGVIVDLNNHTINKRVAIRNEEHTPFNITLKNGIINGGEDNYAITVHNRAQSADKYVIRLEDIISTSGETGLSTNGSVGNENATIIAKNCTFGSKAGDYGITNGSVCGVYLPAKYTYKFENCSFYGLTGYYTKSGKHTLTNCTVEGLKETYVAASYNGSGANETGSGFVADSALGYQTPLEITIVGGVFKSVDGFAIEEVVTTSSAVQNDYTTLDITGNPSLTSGTGKEGYKIITNEN